MPGVYPALITMAAWIPGGGAHLAALRPGCSAASALAGLCRAELRHRGQSNVTSQGWQLADTVYGHEQMMLHRHHLQCLGSRKAP